MASFRIWSRVTPIGQDQYLAMVAALPERGVTIAEGLPVA